MRRNERIQEGSKIQQNKPIIDGNRNMSKNKKAQDSGVYKKMRKSEKKKK